MNALRPIVFTADDRYIKPLAVALAGLKRHAGSPGATTNRRSRRKIYLFHEGLNPLYRVMLIRWLAGSPLALSIVRMRARHSVRRLPHHFSRAILLRLSVAEHISEPEFVYLDADVLVNGEYSLIDAFQLDGAILAASPRQAPPSYLLKGDQPIHPPTPARTYYASGMLVIDGRRFSAERIGERCLELVGRERLEFPDQDALNLICPPEAWVPLPARLSVEVSDQSRDEAETGRMTATAAVTASAPDPDNPGGIFLQLAGAEKPWHLWNRHPLRNRFHQELRGTPFHLMPCGPEDIRWRSLLSRLRRRMLTLIGISPAEKG